MVLLLAMIFIIAVVANTVTGYMFFYRHINVLLLIGSVSFVLFVVGTTVFRKIKKETLL
ncbi:hypothetical protein RG47T_3814 [Mucilaginibacter polytrichastri]|uniref:Uncharacterized protein n=1 Tax=Mucilaginibacter polytrichastri TaxID=1302689 RepID=A0A1Q6A2X1_9SPHI|nr:hypothetical protein RG47T_3814 [Mucilaginibacter polytrichastri]